MAQLDGAHRKSDIIGYDKVLDLVLLWCYVTRAFFGVSAGFDFGISENKRRREKKEENNRRDLLNAHVKFHQQVKCGEREKRSFPPTNSDPCNNTQSE